MKDKLPYKCNSIKDGRKKSCQQAELLLIFYKRSYCAGGIKP